MNDSNHCKHANTTATIFLQTVAEKLDSFQWAFNAHPISNIAFGLPLYAAEIAVYCYQSLLDTIRLKRAVDSHKALKVSKT